jgi:hypothetical protein
MGEDLFPTRLLFRGGYGCAKHAGVRVELKAAPEVAGIPQLLEVDWWPHRGELRVSAGAWREATREEGDLIMAALVRLAYAARMALDGSAP